MEDKFLLNKTSAQNHPVGLPLHLIRNLNKLTTKINQLFCSITVIQIVIIVKFFVAGIFSSDFMDLIFIPFTSHFVQNLDNPWQSFYLQNPSINFPYNPLMLFILTPFACIIHFFEVHSLFFINLIMKIPTFIADWLIYYCLCLQLPTKKKEILLYYFSSPIIIFACYAHSQLDLIPTAFLFISIFLLSKNKFLSSSFLLGAALSTKAHIILAFPFMLAHIYKSKKKIITVKFSLISMLVMFCFCCPFIFSKGFSYFIFHNKEKNLMLDIFFQVGNLKIYLAPLAIFVLFLRFMTYQNINKDFLISFLGIVFSIFVLLVVPTPGWYIWGLPFLVHCLICNHRKNKELYFLYFILCLLYLGYFIAFYQHPLQNLSTLSILGFKFFPIWKEYTLIKNITLTFLEGTLSIIIYFSYFYGLKSNIF